MQNSEELASLLMHVSDVLLKQRLRCVVAESCTGGKLSAALTDRAGSSQWFDRGFVTYSNASKQQLLGVSEPLLTSFGAVSEETVCAMVTGALANSDANIGIAVSGIAGPGGGSQIKPVGTVWIAWGIQHFPPEARCYHFSGDRASIRAAAVVAALEGMLTLLQR